MKHRGKVLVTAGVVGLGFAVLAVGWRLTAPPPHTITREAFHAIEAGMAEAQVRDRFGGVPPGDYTTRKHLAAVLDGGFPVRAGTRKEWKSDRGVFWVWFDAEGRVTATHAPAALLIPPEPFLNKAYRWLGL